MLTDPPEPQVPAQGVRTPEDRPVIASRLCPICLKEPLQGGQTACSAACRRKRSRQREAEGREIRDREVLALLEHAERLEERAAELRAQACQHMRTVTRET
jgi:hypothetical protein